MPGTNTKVSIVRSAGKRGKTKSELADAVGLSLSQTAKVVNDLVFSGDLTVTGKTASGASIFAKPVLVEEGDRPVARRRK